MPYRAVLVLVLLLVGGVSHASSAVINQLSDHPSPYLRAHGGDPVHWQRWDKSVLARAQKENKLILISSGYFACHWCHVMQRESFQNAEIAAQLNRDFIAVKIDRETEPALDARLMAYAQSTLQRGGWPLNVFVSPDGLEVLATLYLPPTEFKTLLDKLNQVWVTQSERVRVLAKEERVPKTFADAKPELSVAQHQEWVAAVKQSVFAQADLVQGGFEGSNKFPSAPQLSFMLERYVEQPDPDIAEWLRLTLDAMANQGMWDHLEGGFFRYTVDPAWATPHFEKMLYDNAQLAQLYLRAASVFDYPTYADVAQQTLDFMLGAMWDEQSGGFYAAFSAIDGQDVEGGAYLWMPNELQALLSDQEWAVVQARWRINGVPELEAGFHLLDPLSLSVVADELSLPEKMVAQYLAAAEEKMRLARAARVLPVDDKRVTAWNALALSALAEAAQVLDSSVYRQRAFELLGFLRQTVWREQTLQRAYTQNDGQAQFLGQVALSDYAYLAEALLEMHALGDAAEQKRLLAEAAQLIDVAWQRFYAGNAWQVDAGSLLPPIDGEELVADAALFSPSARLISATLRYVALALPKADEFNAKTLMSWQQRALSALNRGKVVLLLSGFWYVSHADVLAAELRRFERSAKVSLPAGLDEQEKAQ